MCRLCVLLFSLSLLVACAADRHPAGWVEKDLLSYGLPVKLMAPDSVEVKTLNKNKIVQDITLRQGDDYYIQIFASPAQTTDLARLKADRLDEVRSNPYFKRIVEEHPDGFLYEMEIDDRLAYGFHHVLVKGDREFAFQNGLSSLFTEEQARLMYEAVRGE